MVEATVLHHDHHNVLNPRGIRVGQVAKRKLGHPGTPELPNGRRSGRAVLSEYVGSKSSCSGRAYGATQEVTS
jgi:hypothetical protein